MKKNHFNARIQLSEMTIPVIDVFFDSIEYFNLSNPNIFLELYLWYDKNNVSDDGKIKLINLCKIKNIALHERPLLNIPFFADISPRGNDYSCKFNVYYEDSNAFINSVFQFYSLIKASLNKEVINENRNDRKQAFYRKAQDKRAAVDDKTKSG